MEKLTLKYVWGQKQIPVVLRRTGRGKLLRVRLPYAETNRDGGKGASVIYAAQDVFNLGWLVRHGHCASQFLAVA